MRRAWLAVVGVVLVSVTSGPLLSRPAPPPVDFVRDVRPIFEKYCYDCHGEETQMNGFRLDRRADARRGGSGVMIGGSAMSSRLYLRLIGANDGRRMPVEGDPPTAAEIETIRQWIDQGAPWPDSASGDPPVVPLDAAAVDGFAALRRGDRQAFLGAVLHDPKLSTLRGPGGAGAAPRRHRLLVAALAVGREDARDAVTVSAQPMRGPVRSRSRSARRWCR